MSETNNEPTFRLHQKICRKIEKKSRKILLGQNCLKRIMSQLSEFLTLMKTIIFNENNNFIICGTINIYYIIYLHVLSASLIYKWIFVFE